MAKQDKIILIGFLLFLSFLWLLILSLPDKNLHLVFCDVGQGDAILVSKGTTQMLVDGGPDSSVLKCLSDNIPFWDRYLEVVFLTHPDKDHLTGLIDVIDRYRVKYFVLNPIGKNEESFRVFVKKLAQENATYIFPVKNEEIKAGGVVLRLFWPEKKITDSRKIEALLANQKDSKNWEKVLKEFVLEDEVNEYSLVLKLNYGDFCAFLPGDISSEVEEQLNFSGNCEILKIAHHGSKFSTSDSFLKEIKPSLAVISVGKNWFGHPAEEVLKRLENQSVKVLRTDKNGEIEIVSDGKNWWLKQ